MLILRRTGWPTFPFLLPLLQSLGFRPPYSPRVGPTWFLGWTCIFFLHDLCVYRLVWVTGSVARILEASLIFWAYLKIYQLKPKLELMSIDKARFWWICQLQWHRQLWVDQKCLTPSLPLTCGRFPGTTSSVHYIRTAAGSPVLLKTWGSRVACFVTDAPLQCLNSYIEKQMIKHRATGGA